MIIKNIGKDNLKLTRIEGNGVPKDRCLINKGDKKIIIKYGFVIGVKKVLMNPTEEIWLLPNEKIDFIFDKVIDRYRVKRNRI